MTIIFFIIALGVLIFVHELGHFLVAKRSGICVEIFSLGFGPRLVGFRRGETDYRLSALPLGGYVKMRGEEPGEGAADPRSFAGKGIWTRARVVLFGPLMNLFFCLAFMPVVFMIGREEPAFLREPPVILDVREHSPAAVAGLRKGDRILAIDGKPTESWEGVLNRALLSPGSVLTLSFQRGGDRLERTVKVEELPEIRGGYVGIEPMLFVGNEATIDGVRPQGPAERAGLKAGDRVLSFGGHAVADWLDLAWKVDRTNGTEAPIVVRRGGETLTLQVRPEFDQENGRWLIGIVKDRRSGVPMVVRRYGFLGAVVAGTKENVKLAGLTVDVLWRLVTRKLSYKVLGGPIIIAKTSAAAASSGLADFLYFLAFLSLQLSILNVLPIPVLDGGNLLFFGIEWIRRRPMSVRVRHAADQVGFALLVSLMLVVTYNDIDHIWGLGEVVKRLFR